MIENTCISIYNPSIKTGGTNNLMFNLAVLLNTQNHFKVFYLDYKESPLVEISKDNNYNLNHIEIKDENKVYVDEGILIATLLTVKLIGKRIILSDQAKMIFWSTHPDDGLKILSSFNIWLRSSHNCKVFFSNVFHPFFKKRIKKFMELGVKHNGIVFMDNENIKSNRTFYDLKENASIIPIFTDYPSKNISTVKLQSNNNIIKIVVLGRFTDFKVNSIYGFIEQIIEFNLKNTLKIQVNFIGNGPLLEGMKEWINNKGLQNCNYYGHVNLPDIDELVIKHDILVGMGTSVLEAAKLKIPSLLIDASYDRLPKEKVLLNWLYEAKSFEVARFVSIHDKNINGRNISDLIWELKNSKDDIGEKCYNHWLNYHSPKSTLKKFSDIIELNSFSYKDHKYYLKEDINSKTINFVKNKLN